MYLFAKYCKKHGDSLSSVLENINKKHKISLNDAEHIYDVTSFRCTRECLVFDYHRTEWQELEITFLKQMYLLGKKVWKNLIHINKFVWFWTLMKYFSLHITKYVTLGSYYNRDCDDVVHVD